MSEREILFRGKRVDKGRWIEGYLSFVYIDVPEKARIYSPVEVRSFDVITETVGQYTGLCDKNGTRIFEGDILSAHFDDDDAFPEEETRGCVCWNDYGWHIKIGAHLDTLEQDWVSRFFEVIGNIHDNPELLKGD